MLLSSKRRMHKDKKDYGWLWPLLLQDNNTRTAKPPSLMSKDRPSLGGGECWAPNNQTAVWKFGPPNF